MMAVLTSLVAQVVNTQPAVCGIGWEDPLEKGMSTYSSNFAWKISWTEGPSRLQSKGLQRD